MPFDLYFCRKNVDDFTGPRERSDLGFLTFDLSADILSLRGTCLVIMVVVVMMMVTDDGDSLSEKLGFHPTL